MPECECDTIPPDFAVIPVEETARLRAQAQSSTQHSTTRMTLRGYCECGGVGGDHSSDQYTETGRMRRSAAVLPGSHRERSTWDRSPVVCWWRSCPGGGDSRNDPSGLEYCA
ncbi:hypothetical protein CBL_14245 [Carabus blaptoides fortunei]